MTTITGTLLDVSGTPVVGERVTAVLVAATEVLTAGGQIIRETETRSGTGGDWSLTLTPTSALVEDGGAHYIISAAGHRWTIEVPASGTHGLHDPDIIVEPGPLSPTGATVAALAAHAAHANIIVLTAAASVPPGTPAGTVIVRTS